jgi:hypothetical protein
MLTLEDYELIRRKLLVDKQSNRAIAKELGHSRKTVAKAARHAQPPGYPRATPRGKPAIDAYQPCQVRGFVVRPVAIYDELTCQQRQEAVA